MNVLLINQCFYPDVVAVSQYLTDLAVELSAREHKVTVLVSNRAYDDPTVKFPSRELWKNVEIIRVPTLGFGRKSKWWRIVDFLSFFLSCIWRIIRLPRQEVVI